MSRSQAEKLRDLIGLLDLEEIDADVYRGRNEPAPRMRLFGGQVAAQALVAAGRTVSFGSAHSLHGYFLRPGDPERPVVYHVERLRDGKSFVTRHVVARQRGQAIFDLSVSFQAPQEGYEHQQLVMPEAPDPESLPTWSDRVRAAGAMLPDEARGWALEPRPIDLRHVLPPTFLGGEPREGGSVVWFRAGGPVPDDPFLHQCLVTYATDMSLLDNIILPHGRRGRLGPVMMASLDHAVWFHHPVRADEWLLYAQDSPAAAGARGFARGSIFTRQGKLVVSVAQEGLMRPAGAPEDRSQ
ncbi:MAG TPA: acyl-CoA thioesterase II [Myxococcota bacterium]|nr:acyl-CoA thioesterase II [Myxococcota bacterium]